MITINNPPLRKIILSGQLGKRYGKTHRFCLDTNTPAEAFAALMSQKAGFAADLMQSKDRGIGYAIFVGDRNITADELNYPVGNDDVRIVPVIMGSKNSGIFSIILGIVIIAAATIIGGPVGGATAASWYGSAMGVGIAMIAGGVVQLLTPIPKGITAKDKPENTPSYTFNGPVNTQAQGNPVPLLYGRLKVGSAVISAGIDTLDTSYYPGGTSPGNGSMGGGGGCVTVDSYVHRIGPDGVIEHVQAGSIRVGDTIAGADPVTLEPIAHVVTYSEPKAQPCVELESLGGVRLTCSCSAPIPTTSGLTLAPDVDGHEIAAMDGLGARWEGMHDIRDIGWQLVQHISIDDGCFWSGLSPDSLMLHHNKLATINVQEGR